MPAPMKSDQLLELIRKSNLVDPARLDDYLKQRGPLPGSATELAQHLLENGYITNFQKDQLLQGKWRGYTIGKFKVLERLGAGGMGSVYLCEHQKMKHKVAVKVLPTAKAADPGALGRFYREARAAGVLDHPNLVKAHDIDQDGDLHYLVMDYVDGINLQHLVTRSTGALPFPRACNYIYQTALGLQHAFERGLIHRDIKPANLLIDREGIVRILDMGLARFYEDNNDLLTLKYDDNNVLGTADYVSPEQAIDSHDVDIRADIYSLGATFYFLLTGRPLFPEGKVAQKLIFQQTKEPTSIRQLRPDILPELQAIVEKMIAKDRAKRYQTPAEVITALEPWTRTPVAPPSDEEIPLLSLAARLGSSEVSSGGRTPSPRPGPGTSTKRHGISASQAHGTLASLALPATGPSAYHATPRMLAGDTDVEATRANPQPAITPPMIRPPSRLGRAIYIAFFLVLGASAGYSMNYLLRGYSSDDNVRRCPGRVLPVYRTDGPGQFSSIAAALKIARPGDCIQVREHIWEEVLRLESGTVGQGVTIQGVGQAGQPVIWQAPSGQKDLVSLLHLTSVPGLKIRNFVLDGRDSTQHLVTLAGPCSGTILDGLHMRGFRTSAVRLTSAVGDETAPLLLENLHIAPTHDAQSGVLLDSLPDQPSRFVRLRQCRLEGQCRSGLVIQGPAFDIEMVQCQFRSLMDGVLVRKGNVSAPVQMSLVDNLFQEVSRTGLAFESPPPVENSRVTLKENRFEHVKQLARIEGFKPEPTRTNASWIWNNGTTEMAGKVGARKRFKLENVPTRALLSIVADPSYTLWVNGQRVGQGNFSEASRHVTALDVTRLLRQGDNVIAVEAVQSAGRSGILVELGENSTGVFTQSIASDATWKTSARLDTGWTDQTFDDKDWTNAKVVATYGKGESVWCGLIWEAVLHEQFKYQSGQVFPTPTGNERDESSVEGFPSFEAKVKRGTQER